MSNKLVAVLACRNTGSRLFGKPLQNLEVKSNVTILDHLISLLSEIDSIAEVVLAISEGEANKIFIEYAKKYQLKFVVGDEKDVLGRLIQGAKYANASDVFRITSESPFPYYQKISELYNEHLESKNDATFFMKCLPDGVGFEIITVDALQRSHTEGESKHRSELCSLYIRENLPKFKVKDILPHNGLQRNDIRLTVDYPEDLVICREIYANLRKNAPLIQLEDIIAFLDSRPDLIELVKKYI